MSFARIPSKLKPLAAYALLLETFMEVFGNQIQEQEESESFQRLQQKISSQGGDFSILCLFLFRGVIHELASKPELDRFVANPSEFETYLEENLFSTGLGSPDDFDDPLIFQILTTFMESFEEQLPPDAQDVLANLVEYLTKSLPGKEFPLESLQIGISMSSLLELCETFSSKPTLAAVKRQMPTSIRTYFTTLASEIPRTPSSTASLPSEMKVRQHPHVLCRSPMVYAGTYGCDICRKDGQGWVYHCEQCGFDAHPHCTVANKEEVVATSRSPPPPPTPSPSRPPPSPSPSMQQFVQNNVAANSKKREFDAFLSHCWAQSSSSRDTLTHQKVVRISNLLSEHGVKCWIDETNMGSEVRSSIEQGMDKSNTVVVFMTNNYYNKVASYNEADNCFFEFRRATTIRRFQKKIIFVILEELECRQGDWEGPFGNFNDVMYVDLRNEAGWRDGLSKLSQRIKTA